MRCLILLMSVVCSCTIALASNPHHKGKVDLAFEQNVGQAKYTDGSVVPGIDAVLNAGSVTAYVHNKGMNVVVSQYHKEHADSLPTYDLYRVDIELVASNPFARFESLERGLGFARFIGPQDDTNGRIAQRWKTIVYRDVYPNIDMRMQCGELGPKVDFIVHPGGDPSRILVRYNGAQQVHMQDNGSVAAYTPMGMLVEQAPVSWTELNGVQTHAVESSYELQGNSYKFELGEYNKNETLIIDPQRIWATYYGFNRASGDPYVGMDKVGNIYMASTTGATNMPKSNGVFQKNYRAGGDAFIAKFDEAGKFLWHTYMGGSRAEYLNDCCVNDLGELWICGMSESLDIPLFDFDMLGSGPIGGLEDDTLTWTTFGYVMRLKTDGSWGDSWLLDSDGYDEVNGITYKNSRLAIVGTTRSRRNVNGVTGNPYKRDSSNNYSNIDAFICRLVLRTGTTDRWDKDWFTYYGGSLDDQGQKISLDANGNVVACGFTLSTNLPVSDASTNKGAGDFYVIRFNTPSLHNPQRTWASYVGGTGTDWVNNITMDSQGNPIVVGRTGSTNFPLTSAFKNTLTLETDGFIRKLNGGTGIASYSTYFGGNGGEELTSVMCDKNDRIWICGMTSGTNNMPVSSNAFQSTAYLDANWILTDGYFAQLSADGATLIYGTYYGAPPQATLPPLPGMPPTDPPPPNTDFGGDNIRDIWVDQNAYIVLSTKTESIRFSTTAGAYQDSSVLKKDTMQSNDFLSYFSNCPDSVINVIVNGSNYLCQGDTRQLLAPTGFARYQWSRGDTTRTINVTDSGRYIVVCTTSDGCRYRDTVQMFKNPQPSVSAGRDTSGCVNTLIVLNATPSSGTPPYKYKWKRVESGPAYINDDTLQAPGVNPNTTSRYMVTLTDSVGCTAKDTVLVTIIDPKPTFKPDTVNFGSLDACQSTKDTTFVVRNPMTYAIAIDNFESNWAVVSLVTPISPPLNIPANDSVRLTIRISPSAAGTTTGTFTLKGTPCSWAIAVPFKAVKQQMLASVSPSAIDFGAWPDCQSMKRDTFFTIRNASPDVMNIQQPQLNGAPFSASAPTLSIPKGDSLRITVSFDPTANGTFTDVVRVPFQAGTCSDTFRVDLRGGRYAVQASAFPTTVDIGTMEGCDDSKDTSFYIHNTSSVPITADVQSTAEVLFNPSGSVPVPAGDSVLIVATIRPAASGPFASTVTIPVQPCNLSLTVSFSAVKNSIAFTVPASIDFGELSYCATPVTKTSNFTITYTGTGTSMTSSVVNGLETTTTLSAGTIFQSGQPQTFSVTWSPNADGALVDSMVIIFEPCSIRRVVQLVGSRTSTSIRAALPNLVATNINGGFTGTLEFLNDGTDTVKVNTSALTPNVTISNQSPPAAMNVLPGGVVTVDFDLKCNGRTTYLDSVQAVTTGACVKTATTEFSGTCTEAAVASATIVIDSAAVHTGTNFTLPMRISASTGLNAAGLHNWKANITYDPMIVVGRGNTPDCYVEGQFFPCTATITGTRGTDTVGTLFEFEFTSILGPRDRTPIEITTFTWLEDTALVSTTQDGYVRLTDICYANGERLLTPKANPFSIKVFPNPASTEFTIEILGMGQTAGTWLLYSYIGSLVGSGPLTPDQNGNVSEVIPVTGYPNGVYILSIDARGSVLRQPLTISR